MNRFKKNILGKTHKFWSLGLEFQVSSPWASEGFFPGGATRRFFLKFSRGAKKNFIC